MGEHELAHTTMPLAEEKKALQQIKELNRSKGLVDGYSRTYDELKAAETARKEIVLCIQAKDSELTAAKQAREAEQASLDATMKEAEAKTGDLPNLNTEFDTLKAKAKDASLELRTLREKYRKDKDEYYKKQKEWWVAKREEKLARDKEWDAERKRRAEERRLRDEENK